MSLGRFYVWMLRLALSLAAVGQLQTCTMQLAGLTPAKSQHGISYGKFSRMLNEPPAIRKVHSSDGDKNSSP